MYMVQPLIYKIINSKSPFNPYRFFYTVEQNCDHWSENFEEVRVTYTTHTAVTQQLQMAFKATLGYPQGHQNKKGRGDFLLPKPSLVTEKIQLGQP